MIIRDITASDRLKFNDAVGHPLQAFEWGQFRQETGVKVIRKAIFEGDKLITPVQVTIHQLPKVNWKIGYFPRGPMPDEDQMKLLTQIGKQEGLMMIKLEPNVAAVINDGGPKVQAWETVRTFLRSFGARPGRSLFTDYSFQLDLTESEEKLLKNMHSKTRYNIRLAERKGVKVAVDNSPASFEWFLKLLFEQTVVRQGFYAHTPDYFKKLWGVLAPAGIAHLLRAYVGDKTLAVFMVFKFNNWLYYPYGASTREEKELMAPNLAMWEAIRFGKKEGCKKFDLWGALSPTHNKNDPWYGFHRFKEGYGGKLVGFIGSYDLVLEPKKYLAYRAGDSLRWAYLRTAAAAKRMQGQLSGVFSDVPEKVGEVASDAIKTFEKDDRS